MEEKSIMDLLGEIKVLVDDIRNQVTRQQGDQNDEHPSTLTHN